MAQPGTVTVTMRNNQTGHEEVYMLREDDYAILYGPELEVFEDYRNMFGVITVKLRPKRR